MLISNKNEIWFTRVVAGIISFGVIAAIINFLHNRSLWFDESLLALNVVNKSYLELLRPLDYNQVAPVGFLFIEKFLSTLTGNHDWSLRIFPFLCYIGSFPLLYFFNMKLHGSKYASLVCVAFFAINSTIVYYSFEVKQYSTDVFAAILLLFIGLKLIEDIGNKKTAIIYSIIGTIAVFISNVSIVLIITNFIVVFYKRYFQKKKLDYFVWIPIFSWIISFTVYFYFFIYHHPSKKSMLRYWTQKDAFLPINTFNSKPYLFIYDKMNMIFNSIISNNTFGWIYFILFAIGLFLFLKMRKSLFIIILPVILHLILSSLKLYPFHSRLILYLIPLFLTVISFAFYFVFERLKEKKPMLSFVVLILLFLNAYSLASIVPFEKEEVKKCMDYISKDPEEYENIYLYCSTDPVFKFYQKNYDCFNKKINYIQGDWHREDWSKHSQDIKKINGDSWLIFSEVYISNGKSEADYIIDMLKLKGFSIVNSKEFAGAICYKVSKN